MRLLYLSLLLLSTVASADSRQPLLDKQQLENELTWLHEEQVVFSASKVKESIDKTAATVTVIESEEIEAMGARYITEVLDKLAGVHIHKQRHFVDSIEVRGVATESSEKVLMMLNGHPLDNNLVNGGAMWVFSRLSLDYVERIEVVRGPASALYGANAFLALVNIVTKSPKSDEIRSFRQTFGSDNTLISNLLYSGQIDDDMALLVNLHAESSDGDRAHVASDGIGRSGDTDPWFKTRHLYTEFSYKDFSLYVNYLERQDGPYLGLAHVLNSGDRGDTENYYFHADYKHAFSDQLQLEVKAYHDHMRFDNFWEIYPDGLPAPVFTAGLKAQSGATNTKTGLETIVTYTPVEDSTFIFGAMAEKQKQFDITYATTYDPLTLAPLPTLTDQSAPGTTWAPSVKRDFKALYGEYLYDLTEQVRLNMGGRYDVYSDFGEVFNPRLGVSWNEEANLYGLKAVYGEGFRAPTFAELYNINNPALLGNPNLKPERIKTYELTGYVKPLKPLKLQLTYFNNTIDELISKSGNLHTNLGTIKSEGIESELTYALERGSKIAMNYTYLDSEGQDGASLAQTARHKAHLTYNVRLHEKFSLYAHLFYTSAEKRDATDSRPENSGYMLADMTLWGRNLMPNKQLDLKLAITNLFDKAYKHASPVSADLLALQGDYPMPGRKLYFEATYHF